jgi:hypothetical protein
MSRFEDLNVIERQNIYNTRLWKLGNQKARISGQLPVGEGEMTPGNFIALLKKTANGLNKFINSLTSARNNIFEISPMSTMTFPQTYESILNSLDETIRRTKDFIKTLKDLKSSDRTAIAIEANEFFETSNKYINKFNNIRGINLMGLVHIGQAAQTEAAIMLVVENLRDKVSETADLLEMLIDTHKSLGIGGGYAVPGYSSQDSSIPRKYL